jgi:hypothetical protein
MARKVRIGWNNIYERFFVLDDNGETEMPSVSQALLDDLFAWKKYLLDNFTPEDSVLAGVWRPDTRRWFLEEASRLERELRRELAGRPEYVRVDRYPGIIPIYVYADYGDWPLWSVEGGTSPADFPMLSNQLRTDLTAWAVATEVGPPTPTIGDDLVRRLQAELGPEFQVTY